MEKLNTKKCSSCKVVRELSHFVSLKNGKETKSCKRCREYSQKNRENKANNYQKIVGHIQTAREDGQCQLCGDQETSHLEFDHIDPSEKMCQVNQSPTFAKLETELDKCRLLCGKCHRKITQNVTIRDGNPLTANIRNTKRARVERNKGHVNKAKIAIAGCQMPKCADTFDPDVLSFYEFHHIDYKTKSAEVSRLVFGAYSTARIDEEISRCILVCRYCHLRNMTQENKNKAIYFDSLPAPVSSPKTKSNKLSVDTVKEMRRKYSTHTLQSLSDEYQVPIRTVTRIVTNRTYYDPDYEAVVKRPSRTDAPLLIFLE